jgi:hypothetical protein
VVVDAVEVDDEVLGLLHDQAGALVTSELVEPLPLVLVVLAAGRAGELPGLAPLALHLLLPPDPVAPDLAGDVETGRPQGLDIRVGRREVLDLLEPSGHRRPSRCGGNGTP